MAKKSKRNRQPKTSSLSDEDCLEEPEVSEDQKNALVTLARTDSIGIEGPGNDYTVFVAAPRQSISRLSRGVARLIDEVLVSFRVTPTDNWCGNECLLPAASIQIPLFCGDLTVVSGSNFATISPKHHHIEVRHRTGFRTAAANLGFTVERLCRTIQGNLDVALPNVFIQRVKSALTNSNGPMTEILANLAGIINITKRAKEDQRLDDRLSNPSIKRFGHLVVAVPCASGLSPMARTMGRNNRRSS